MNESLTVGGLASNEHTVDGAAGGVHPRVLTRAGIVEVVEIDLFERCLEDADPRLLRLCVARCIERLIDVGRRSLKGPTARGASPNSGLLPLPPRPPPKGLDALRLLSHIPVSATRTQPPPHNELNSLGQEPWTRSESRCVGRASTSRRTLRRVKTLTVRTDPEVERALASLTRDGRSRSAAARAAILDAERAQRRDRLRAEAEALRDDPDDRAASQALASEMEALRAW